MEDWYEPPGEPPVSRSCTAGRTVRLFVVVGESNLRFNVLGPLVATERDRMVALPGGRTAALACWLVLHANQPVSVDATVAALWPAAAPPSAARQVRALAGSLAQLLGAGRVQVGERLRLTADDDAVDAWRFERLARSASALLADGQVEPARAALEQALSLWRGDPYLELERTVAAIPVIDHLAECRLQAIEDLHGIELAGEVTYRLVAALRAEVIHHAGRPRLWHQLAIALYRTGRQTEALAALAEARRSIGANDAAVRQLETAIVCHDPGLDHGELAPA
jgi:DNA-binding SARP family transcriptional activator